MFEETKENQTTEQEAVQSEVVQETAKVQEETNPYLANTASSVAETAQVTDSAADVVVTEAVAEETVQEQFMTGESAQEQSAQANPFGAQAASPIPEEPKKNNSATKVAIALVAVAAVLIIAIVAIAFSGLFGNKKTEIAKAMKATFSESGDYLKEVWMTEQYEGMFKDKEYSVEAEFELPEGIGFEMEMDATEEESDLWMDISMAGSSFVELEGYFTETQLFVALPELFDYVFFMDLETIEDDIWVMVDNGMIDEESAELLVESLDTEAAEELSEEASEQLLKDIKAAWDKFYKEIEAEKIDSKKIKVNGEKEECKGYALIFTAEQTATLFEEVVAAYTENEEVMDIMETTMEAMDEDIDDALDEIEDFIDEIRDEGDEEAQMEFYLHDGKVVQIYMEDHDGEETVFEWTFAGGNFPMENMEMKLGSEYDGYFELIRSGSMKDGKYKAEYEIIDDYGTSYILDVRYTPEDGEVSMEYLEDEWSYLFLMGTFEKTDDSTLEIEVDTFEVEDEELLSGEMVIVNEAGDIEKPDGEEINFLTMTEEEWTDIIMEAYEMFY